MPETPGPVSFNVAHTPSKAATYVLEALEANENVNGAFTHRAARWLREMYGPSAVLLTHSATAALELAAMVLAEERGACRVYMPSFTFASTANAYLRSGYEVHFVDIDPGTMCAGVAQFAEAEPEPGSVIVPVHYAGNPAEISEIAEWARSNDLIVSEDAAQALGSAEHGRFAGTFGVAAAISFHFTKNIHSSMGGALFLMDESLTEPATYAWERGTNRQALLKGLVDKYSWVALGSSFQSTELQAALLMAGLEEYDAVLEARGRLWRRYSERLSGSSDRGLHVQRWLPSARSNHHAFYVRLETEAMADGVREALRRRRITAYVGYVPLHDAPYGRQHKLDVPLPETERWAGCVLRLPMHTAMTHDDVDRTCDVIDEFLSFG